jgi:geranylgeranyl pyrophosphate synthase
LHDDVVDESDLRRGETAARLLWGNEASVLVGDFLLGQAFKMMVDVGSLGCLRILSDAAAVIAEGEVMQLITAKNTETTEDDYLAVIDAKTAALFAAAAEVGAVIANRPKSEAAGLRSYGRNLGLAFQLVDDALDYHGEQSMLGKSVGDDFREGKITLPVVLCYRRGNAIERITAPSLATRSPSSPTATPRPRCSTPWRSASTARSSRRAQLGREPINRLVDGCQSPLRSRERPYFPAGGASESCHEQTSADSSKA